MVLLGNLETAIAFAPTIFCQAESRNLLVALCALSTVWKGDSGTSDGINSQ